MKLNFIKRAGKFDDLVIEAKDQAAQRIQCPKQGMIPHDMVHFAVESILSAGGFLSKIDHGEAAGFAMTKDDAAEAVERLVEAMQAEIWSGEVPADELIALYHHACAARNHPALPVTAAIIEAIRAKLKDLTRQWDQVAVNGSLTLMFEPV
jgi:hypothetical protein